MTDLLATSGDYLRVWRAGEPETKLECLLNNNKNSDFCAPLTSFDWNEVFEMFNSSYVLLILVPDLRLILTCWVPPPLTPPALCGGLRLGRCWGG